MPTERSARQRSASFDRSVSEGLVDLNVFVVSSDIWKNNLTTSVDQIVTDSVSAGYIRVHPESVLNDLRREIDRQLGYDAVPRDYIFLRCLGRCFTQVKTKQENELKVKYFVPPRTYSPELYILNASAVLASRFSTSSHSSHPSVHLQGETTSRVPPFLPPAYGLATLPSHQQDLTYRDRDKPDDLLRRKHEEDLRRRQEEAEEAEEEEKRRRRLREEEEEKRRRLREEEEENERTKRLIEELETKRREELEDRRRMEEEEHLRRRRRLEEEEEEERFRLRRLIEEDGRRQHSQELGEEISRPRTPSPTTRQTTFEKNEPRDLWKKRFFEEKKRTGPREDNTKIMKEELDNINRKIIDQMEAIKDSSRKPEHTQNSPDKANKMKLDATKMENEIEDLQSKLQSTKMHLTSEMKLRNQSERELQFLKAELAQLKTTSLPRLDDEANPRIAKAPIYTNHKYNNGNDAEEEDTEYDEPIVKKTSVQLTYREPKKAPQDMSPAILPEPPAPKTFAVYQGGSLEEAFREFASKNNGLEATGQDIFKWCVDAGILGKSLNNHHIDISFCKVRPKGMKTITMKEMNQLLDELAVKYREDMKLSFQAARRKVIEKLTRAPFKLHGATLVVRAGAVNRLTDVSKYTGSHRERFDPRTGKGKGRDGREAHVENTGYVTNYKLAGSYDKAY